MIQVFGFPQENLVNLRKDQLFGFTPHEIPALISCFRQRNWSALKEKKGSAFRRASPVSCELVDRVKRSFVQQNSQSNSHKAKKFTDEAKKDTIGDDGKFITIPYVQTLSTIPKEELFRKAVMVRFDPAILLYCKKEYQTPYLEYAVSTIKYLYEAGAKVILVSSWTETPNLTLFSEAYSSTQSVADLLSSLLGLKVVAVKCSSGYIYSDMVDSEKSSILLLENINHFKAERSNCSEFARELASGVDILVNDAFSESHKVLASTVGVARFCSTCIAGFYFEEGIHKLREIIKSNKRPYMAIIGGGKLADKAAALRFLASICDGLVFIGRMAFQIMHALGLSVPMKLVDIEMVNEAVNIVECAKSRNIPLVLPIDIWCIKDHIPNQMEISSVYSIPEGSEPVDIGPRSVQKMFNTLSSCKNILWIGSLKFSSSKHKNREVFDLAEALGKLNSCDITFVGKTGFEELLGKSCFPSNAKILKNAVVLWEALKGRGLPGLQALDRAYPFQVDWSIVYCDPTRPLVVDVGSGNGLFLFGMANKTKDMNFLGLEINTKLVDRCLDEVQLFALHNLHFVATNATSTFRSIISSYPGELALVSIQCPNPDFNKPEYRWKMLQVSLVEAISNMLMVGGKVFLQSDIQPVALRMKNEFLKHSNGRLVLMEQLVNMETDEYGWLRKNPFGVPSDWESHVLDRGDPMWDIFCSFVLQYNLLQLMTYITVGGFFIRQMSMVISP